MIGSCWKRVSLFPLRCFTLFRKWQFISNRSVTGCKRLFSRKWFLPGAYLIGIDSIDTEMREAITTRLRALRTQLAITVNKHLSGKNGNFTEKITILYGNFTVVLLGKVREIRSVNNFCFRAPRTFNTALIIIFFQWTETKTIL